MHCASITSAAFEEQYATESGAARSPATEETATSAPFRSSNGWIAALAVTREPSTFTRCTSANPSGSASSSDPGAPLRPALSTSPSSPPKCSTVAAAAVGPAPCGPAEVLARRGDGGLGVATLADVARERERVELVRQSVERLG